MAIADGNYSSTNNTNKTYEPTYYSRYSFVNEDGNLRLELNYSGGLMKISIGRLENGKTTAIETFSLSAIKAMQLSQEMKAFKDYLAGNKVKENVAFGVNGGMRETVSYIGFHTNKDRKVILTIGKFDQNGLIVESQNFVFKKNYNYSLEWSDISKNSLERIFNDYVEFEVLYNAVTDFGRYSTGAAGYTYADLCRYDNNRLNNRFDAIYDKLGIERRSSGYNSQNFNNTFLNNASTSSRTTTIDEMEDLLG